MLADARRYRHLPPPELRASIGTANRHGGRGNVFPFSTGEVCLAFESSIICCWAGESSGGAPAGAPAAARDARTRDTSSASSSLLTWAWRC